MERDAVGPSRPALAPGSGTARATLSVSDVLMKLTSRAAPGSMLCMVDKNDASWLSQLRRGVADRCVLALLGNQERYGFDLAKTLADAHLIAGEGTIYPLLSRLRRDGLVHTVWRESNQGPPRRYYALTAAGSEALGQFRVQWAQFAVGVSNLLGETADRDNQRR